MVELEKSNSTEGNSQTTQAVTKLEAQAVAAYSNRQDNNKVYNIQAVGTMTQQQQQQQTTPATMLQYSNQQPQYQTATSE
jgi:hypothetical protein